MISANWLKIADFYLFSSDKSNTTLIDIRLVNCTVDLSLEKKVLSRRVSIDWQDDVSFFDLGLPDKRSRLRLDLDLIAQLDTVIADGRGATHADALDGETAWFSGLGDMLIFATSKLSKILR